MSQREQAAYFRQLHAQRPLVLPNAWDVASARVIELAGASAIATTSAGVAWSLGRGDGQQLRRDEMIQAIRAIVQTVAIPVTADIEGGYGSGSRAGRGRDGAGRDRRWRGGHQPGGYAGARRGRRC